MTRHPSFLMRIFVLLPYGQVCYGAGKPEAWWLQGGIDQRRVDFLYRHHKSTLTKFCPSVCPSVRPSVRQSASYITDTKNPCVLVLTRCHMLASAQHSFACLHYGLTCVTYDMAIGFIRTAIDCGFCSAVQQQVRSTIMCAVESLMVSRLSDNEDTAGICEVFSNI